MQSTRTTTPRQLRRSMHCGLCACVCGRGGIMLRADNWATVDCKSPPPPPPVCEPRWSCDDVFNVPSFNSLSQLQKTVLAATSQAVAAPRSPKGSHCEGAAARGISEWARRVSAECGAEQVNLHTMNSSFMHGEGGPAPAVAHDPLLSFSSTLTRMNFNVNLAPLYQFTNTDRDNEWLKSR